MLDDAAADLGANVVKGHNDHSDGDHHDGRLAVTKQVDILDKDKTDTAATSEEMSAESTDDAAADTGGGAPPATDEVPMDPPFDEASNQIVSPTDRRAQEAGHGFRTTPKNVGVFFSIYFVMTGLHGLHVLAGMAAISWVLVRAWKGHFSSDYFGPVDYVGLYWHLVDLVWIYLFPLLYLIH